MSPKARPRAKAALDLGSRVQRQERRATLGLLESLRLELPTRKRYVQAYARFALFVTCMALQILTYESLDEAVASYIEELWQAGDPKLWCNDILSALHFYIPTRKRRLPMGWALHFGARMKCPRGLAPWAFFSASVAHWSAPVPRV